MLQFIWPGQPMEFVSCDCHILNSSGSYVIALAETDEAKLKKTGVLTLGTENRVLRLHEKPQSPTSTWSCPPLYFLQPSAWPRLNEYIRVSDQCDAAGSLVDFLSQRETVYAFKLNASRLDIGSHTTYHLADKLLRREPVIPKNLDERENIIFDIRSQRNI